MQCNTKCGVSTSQSLSSLSRYLARCVKDRQAGKDRERNSAGQRAQQSTTQYSGNTETHISTAIPLSPLASAWYRGIRDDSEIRSLFVYHTVLSLRMYVCLSSTPVTTGIGNLQPSLPLQVQFPGKFWLNSKSRMSKYPRPTHYLLGKWGKAGERSVFWFLERFFMGSRATVSRKLNLNISV